MKVFTISDYHFYHKNIARYCNRPDGWMEIAIREHNAVVGEQDKVINLGDFAFASPPLIRATLELLNGEQEIVLGNHDSSKNRMLSSGFSAVYGQRKVPGSGVIFKVRGKLALFTHYPALKLPPGVVVNYHGHVHNNPYEAKPWQVNVSCEVLDYKPMFLCEAEELEFVRKE